EVGVGDGRLHAAAPVADGAGLGARALGPDVDAAGLVDARQRAAARAHLVDVDGRDADGEPLVVAADEEVVGQARDAVLDHAGLPGGAAHVEADGVGYAQRRAQRLAAGDARRGARLEHLDALLAGGRHVVQAAIALDKKQRAAKAAAARG